MQQTSSQRNGKASRSSGKIHATSGQVVKFRFPSRHADGIIFIGRVLFFSRSTTQEPSTWAVWLGILNQNSHLGFRFPYSAQVSGAFRGNSSFLWCGDWKRNSRNGTKRLRFWRDARRQQQQHQYKPEKNAEINSWRGQTNKKQFQDTDAAAAQFERLLADLGRARTD